MRGAHAHLGGPYQRLQPLALLSLRQEAAWLAAGRWFAPRWRWRHTRTSISAIEITVAFLRSGFGLTALDGTLSSQTRCAEPTAPERTGPFWVGACDRTGLALDYVVEGGDRRTGYCLLLRAINNRVRGRVVVRRRRRTRKS